MNGATLLLVDDDERGLKIIEKNLTSWGFECVTARNGLEALEVLEGVRVDLVLTDHNMPKMDGLELLHSIKAKYGELPVIILTAYGTVDKAVISIKAGANDYLQKPYDPDALHSAIRRSLSYHKLSEENKSLKNQLKLHYSFQTIIAKSKPMRDTLEMAYKVAKTPRTTVALYGESGTGKEILARAIHTGGDKPESRFIAVNCAGIPTNLLESELFGHVRGAFTGADRNRDGKFDLAQKGTVLLDEIGDFPLDLQAKLLRTLQERSYEKVGSNKPIKADFRVIIATHRNLEEMVRKGTFREDLYHRINTYPIHIPPLRERKEDIPALAVYFLDQFRKELGKKLPGISQKAMGVLVDYSWPGNVRELKNCIERAAILSNDSLIQPEHLSIVDKAGGQLDPKEDGMIGFNVRMPQEQVSLDAITDRILKIALERCDNNKSKAASMLKVDRTIFYRRS